MNIKFRTLALQASCLYRMHLYRSSISLIRGVLVQGMIDRMEQPACSELSIMTPQVLKVEFPNIRLLLSR